LRGRETAQQDRGAGNEHRVVLVNTVDLIVLIEAAPVQSDCFEGIMPTG
jgi:hypothetical protein